MLLGKIFKTINQNYKSIKFKNIRFNSKDCKSNDIFFAIDGVNTNGNKYIKDAIKNGAKIIVSNLKYEGFDKNNILFIKSQNPRKSLALAASNFYQKKPKNIIAVTGTNGKTSVTDLFYQILKLHNKPVASIGTLGVKFNGKFIKTIKCPVWRFRNQRDLVTRVPWRIMGFKHIGKFCYIDGNHDLRVGAVKFIRLFKDSIKSIFNTTVADGFADHSMSDYIKYIQDCDTVHRKVK